MFIARIESLHVAKNESSLSFKIDTNRIFRFLYPKNRMKLSRAKQKIVQASNIFQYEPYTSSISKLIIKKMTKIRKKSASFIIDKMVARGMANEGMGDD